MVEYSNETVFQKPTTDGLLVFQQQMVEYSNETFQPLSRSNQTFGLLNDNSIITFYQRNFL